MKNIFSFGKLYDKVFYLTEIHAFGCLCYVNTITANRN